MQPMIIREDSNDHNDPAETVGAFCTVITRGGAQFLHDQAAACDEPIAGEPWQELEAELQLPLWGVRRADYEFPDVEQLAALVRTRVQRREEIATDHAKLGDDELFERLRKLYLHRGRGITASDRSVQRELMARSAGVEWVRSLTNIELPRLYGLGLGGGVLRQRLIRALQILDCQGWLGLAGGGHELAKALGFKADSHWWRVIAWLQQTGWIVVVRRYKNPSKSSKLTRLSPDDARCDLYKNFYAPGPELLRWRKYYRSELDGDRALFRSAVRAQQRLIELGTQLSAPALPSPAEHIAAWICSQRAELLDAEAAVRSQRIYATGCYEEEPKPEEVQPIDERVQLLLDDLAADWKTGAAIQFSAVAHTAEAERQKAAAQRTRAELERAKGDAKRAEGAAAIAGWLAEAREAHDATSGPVPLTPRPPKVENALSKEGPGRTASPAQALDQPERQRVPAPVDSSANPRPEGDDSRAPPESAKSVVDGLRQLIADRFGDHVVRRPPRGD